MFPESTAASPLAAPPSLHGDSVCVNLPVIVCSSLAGGGFTGVLRDLRRQALSGSPMSAKQHHNGMLADKCEPLSQLHQLFDHSKS